jgi:low affinity Fe/Cu permease
MSHLGIPALLLLFAGAAVATWIAGVWLAKATDVLDDRFGLGETIGGMVLLSITGALPELAITVSAVTGGHLDIAAGNLIGGVAMQTLVLVIADRFMRGSRPLSTASASLVPALEGTLVICVVGITVMSGLLPATATVGPLGVGSIAIFVVWLVGMLALGRCRDRKDMDLAVPVDTALSTATLADSPEKSDSLHNASTAKNVTIFLAASVVTLVAGVVLEQSVPPGRPDGHQRRLVRRDGPGTGVSPARDQHCHHRREDEDLHAGLRRHLRRQCFPAHSVCARRPAGRTTGPAARGARQCVDRHDRVGDDFGVCGWHSPAHWRPTHPTGRWGAGPVTAGHQPSQQWNFR